MLAIVTMTRKAKKDYRKLPRYVQVRFTYWESIIETEGLGTMQQKAGFRDHALKGKRKGQRSSSLSRSWRVIYHEEMEGRIISVDILEITHHEY